MQIEAVVPRNSLDCGTSAPMGLSNTQGIVTVDPTSYFGPIQAMQMSIYPSFAAKMLGTIMNTPQTTVVYLNSTVTIVPGSMEGPASIIFLAANRTVKDAQERIMSPETTSRIEFMDILVCTSTTRLEICPCTIDMGTVASCNFSRVKRRVELHNYTTNVIFGQTAQGLVQGMRTQWQTDVRQQFSLIAIFGTPNLRCCALSWQSA